MDNDPIYVILKSKSINEHFLMKYIRFVRKRQANPHQESVVTESHHICPKSDDMFPEYIDWVIHPWNRIELTPREHALTHLMLSRFLGGSQITALHMMLNCQNSEVAPGHYRVIRRSIFMIKIAAKAREEYHKNRKGFGIYEDRDGNRRLLHYTDSMITELGMRGVRSGKSHNENTKQKMSIAKLMNRKVKMSFLDLTKKVSLMSPEYDEHIAQGWRPYIDAGAAVDHLDAEDKEYRARIKNEKLGEKYRGTANYLYPDGTSFGERLNPDDPRIAEFGLKVRCTDATKDAARENSKRAREANLGTTWYNNGEINKKFKENPGHPWVIGQIGISDESKKARAEGIRRVAAGTKVYNDGKKHYRVKPGEYMNPEWNEGMIPRKQKS